MILLRIRKVVRRQNSKFRKAESNELYRLVVNQPLPETRLEFGGEDIFLPPPDQTFLQIFNLGILDNKVYA